ncbi:MAG: porin [Chitinophagaceae bacterium]
MKQLCLFITVLLLSLLSFAQDSTKSDPVKVTGFIDLYYQYDFNKPPGKERPSFLYNHKRHNEFSINLALMKIAYATKKLRASIGLMAGNYPQYNLAAEPSLLQFVYEAYIGFSFSDKLNIDAGILPSHIGLETAISKENWNLSRSILAENTPYYETGVKLNYSPGEKWTLAILVLNGWQNIVENNSGKAVGTQVQFKPGSNWLFNSSSFIGNERPDSVKQTRFFHNFYITHSFAKKWDIALLFDNGTEKNKNWLGAAFLLRYLPDKKWAFASRLEYYKDKKGVIVSVNQPGGFKTSGFSLNIDHNPLQNITFRAEARCLHATNDIFTKNGLPSKNNFSILVSVAIGF